MSRTSDIKENVLTGILILTFGFPVIPAVAIWAYSHYYSKPQQQSITSQDNSANGSSVSFPNSSDRPAFHGNSCTSDCSGHEAGYEWAEENEICDTDYDNGNSESFNEGVRSWAEENCEQEYQDDFESL